MLGQDYLRLAAAPLAVLELAEANGEVEAITFGLFCLGFFISRLLRRCFCDIGFPHGGMLSAEYPRPRRP